MEGRRRLSERLRQLRGETSLASLAGRAGLSTGTLSQLESGSSDPTLGTLLRLMRALDLASIEEMLGPWPVMPSASFPISEGKEKEG